MLVLGIETSCDETGVALYDGERGLLTNQLYSQVELHARYGGVVPELASRDHLRKLLPLLQQALAAAQVKVQALDAIAYTAGPGLAGALLVGASLAQALSYAWGLPAVAVHHMEAHLLATLLDDTPPSYPFVALLVSGGHTQLVEVLDYGQYTLLGESIDDAAGEAFDKTAHLLGLGYPGGPQLAKLAEQGDPVAFKFPRPMTDRPGLDFSFSGIKTFARYTIQDQADDEQTHADIASSFQAAMIDTLRIKCQRALKQTGLTRLVVAGGVSANQALRQSLAQMAKKHGYQVHFPALEYCTDNGAMVAFAGYQALLHNPTAHTQTHEISIKPRWLMGQP